MTRPAVLVIDVGTSFIKTSLFGFNCRPIDRVVHPNKAGVMNLAEAAEHLWKIVAESIVALSKQNTECRVTGIGLTGYMHSVIPLDKEGNPLPYSAAECDFRRSFDELVDSFGMEKIYGITGSRLDVASVPPCVLAWQQRSPRDFSKLARILPIKDYLRYRLTGEIATDEIDACGTMFYDLHKRQWDAGLLSYCGLGSTHLPVVLHCTERAGTLRPQMAKELSLPEGTPVAVGGGDDIEILGCGARLPHQVCEHVGSTGSFLMPTKTPRPDPAYRLEVYPAIGRGEWVLGASCSNVTRALDWFLASSIYSRDGEVEWDQIRDASKEVLTAPCFDRPFFLPYLSGERAPIWNPDLTGGWAGLRGHHTSPVLLLSVIEGICFSLRNILEAYADLGEGVDLIYSSGGLNDLDMQQFRASVYGRPVRLVRGADPTAFAAAALTLCSIGELQDPWEAVTWLEYEPDVDPMPAWRDELNERFVQFLRLTQSIARSGSEDPARATANISAGLSHNPST